MNAVEIEQAVSDLVEAPFDRESFAFSFLEAFGNKATTIKKLKVDRAKKGSSNKSDLEGGVLQTKNIHLLVCDEGEVTASLKALVDSPETAKRKAKFALATDGKTIEAENVVEGETLVCDYEKLADNFGFFLALAGITTVKEIRNNAFDIKATSRLNRLYVELLKHNPQWDTAERREEMNHFFARLIFCFFAEDTGIFNGSNLFTKTVEQMSDGSNAHDILTELFRAMNTSPEARQSESTADLRPYATQFPYVNGGLFSGSPNAPKFSKIARSYLIHVGNLDWTQINPDIFGSMIQAVADDEERGALGMHYTSVPNILKVLNPLFLDDLRSKLEEAGDNKRKLLNLRNRMARIRVFDPACGSGNFLVIAYKEMREIEATINKLRGEEDRRSDLPLTNYRGIELRHFSAEIARLALIIAEYQCDVLYRGQKLALLEFLPLDEKNWITCGNALRLDWLKICPPTGTGVKIASDDLFSTPLDQTEMDFENEGGETYICGNPPYKGNARKSNAQKDDLKDLFDGKFQKWGLLDYVSGWFYKSFEYAKQTPTHFAFVATNSVAQGQNVSNFWKPLFEDGLRFFFAVRSFKWSNLAARDAGVTVVIIGGSLTANSGTIYDGDLRTKADNINGYLLPQENHWVEGERKPISELQPMVKGNYYGLSTHIILDRFEREQLRNAGLPSNFLRKFYGSTEVINAKPRHCLWFEEKPTEELMAIGDLAARIRVGKETRSKSNDAISNGMFDRPHQFREMNSCKSHFLAIPVVSSENRDYLPVDLLDVNSVVSNKCFALYDCPLWHFSIIASRLHWAWIGTVCVRMRTDFSYSNVLGWNTFQVPKLTEQNKKDLEHAATEILLAREAHYPSTISELYKPANMPSDLLAAHERNDETLERIYIGRRFKNDTERLEKLFEMYTKMTAKESE